MTIQIARATARKLHFALYEHSHGYNSGEFCADQLAGRSHYYDAETRRFFGSRVLDVYTFCDGLILGTLESVQHPTLLRWVCTPSSQRNEIRRVYRPVFFDMLGNVIARPDIEECAKTAKTGRKRFAEIAATLPDTETESKRVLQVQAERLQRELAELTKEVFGRAQSPFDNQD